MNPLFFVLFAIMPAFLLTGDAYSQSVPEFVTVLDDTNGESSSSTSNTGKDTSSRVTANLEALSEPAMNITVFDETITVTHEQTILRSDTDYTYVGSTSNSKNNVFVAVFGDLVRLELSSAGKNYIIEPKGTDHIVKKFSNVSFGVGGEGSGNPAMNPNYQSIVDNAPTGTYTRATHHNIEIDVMFLYTDRAFNEPGIGSLRMMANLGIDKTNVAFVSSGIPVQLNNIEIRSAGNGYVESGSMVTDLNRLVTKNDGYMERGNSARDKENADIGILFNKHHDGDYCGRAAAILADASNAFAVVNV